MRTVLARQWGGELWSSGGGEPLDMISFTRTFAATAVYTIEEGATGACGCLACALTDAKKPLWGDAQVSPLLNGESGGPQFLGDDIGDNTSTTTSLTIGQSITSTINHGGDLDYVRVSLVAGQTYTFSLAATAGGLADAYVELRNSTGTLIAEDDDGGITYNSFLMFTATTTGDYYVVARGYDGTYTGGYTLATDAIDTGNTSPTSFTPNGLPFYSWEEAAIQITRSGASWATSFGAPVTITYAFRATSTGMPGDVSGFSQFGAAQIAATEAALAAWAAVANITFVRVGGTGYSDNATMLFGNYSSGADEAAAFAYLPTTGNTASNSVQGDVWVNVSLDYNANPVAGDPTLGYGAQVLLHEIGHALGLSHPGDYNAGEGDPIVYPGSADYYGDTRMFTTMSYFGSSNTGGDLPFSAYIPQLHDIAAIQRLYGANVTTRTGDTVYGFNSNTGLPAYSITLSTQSVVFVVWDGGGNDTLDFSGYSTSNVIDMRQEGFSSVGPGGGGRSDYNIAIARGVVIENAIGGSGDDTIIGNDADNVINGGTGLDNMAGGLGNDTYYANTIDTITEGVNAGIDTIISTITRTLGANIENLTLAGSGNNNGTGNELANTLIGNSGNNTLSGLAGNDTLDGGAGADTLLGGDGDDTVFYDAADVAANVQGGAGTDTLVFTSGEAPTTFNLVTQGFERAEGRFTDTGGAEWSTIVRNYDSQWRLDTEATTFDDGARAVNDYDQTSAFVWSSEWTRYDALNRVDVIVTTFDDGSSSNNNHDQDDSFVWSSEWTHYDALNRVDTVVTTFDDATYSINEFDVSDAQDWVTQWTHYDALDRVDTVFTTFDDASYSINEFDVANAQSWSTQWTRYDDQDRVDVVVTTYDDGSYAINDYDQAGQFSWASQFWLYNSSGQVIGYQLIPDGGG